MKSQLRSAALLFLVALSCLAQSSSNDLKAELENLHNRWFAAFDKGDGAAMDGMEVPNLVLVNPDGKGMIWQKHRPRAGKPEPTGATRTLTNAAVRQFGNTAILTGTVTTRETGAPDERASTTVVFVNQSGKWLIASAQWSPIPAPGK